MSRPLGFIGLLTLALAAPGDGALAGADPACDLDFHIRVANFWGPLEGTDYTLWDLIRGPAGPVLPPGEPEENRDNPAKVEVESGRTAADGSIAACLTRAGAAPPDGTWDIVVSVRSVSDAGTVRGPGLVSGTVEQVVVHGVGPMRNEPALVYEAWSREFRDVGSGLFDAGAFTPAQPDSRVPGPVAEALEGLGNFCFDDGTCLDDVGSGSPAGAFAILAQVQRARRFVHDLDEGVRPGAARWAAPVQIHFPQGGCGSGCHYGGGLITTSTADPRVSVHEYGHHIQAQFGTGLESASGHGCGTTHNAAVAWTEGWADFFPAFALGNASYSSCGNAETNFRHPGGASTEGNVVSTLWDLQDPAFVEDPVDGDGVDLWRVFSSGGYSSSIVSFMDRWVQHHPEDADDVHALACMQTLLSETCD